MKKIMTIVVVLVSVFSAHAQCTIDSLAQTRPGIYPKPDSMACIVRSVPYDEVIQVQCPTYFDSVVNFGITSYPVNVTIDSMELDSVIGLPAGITWTKNPNKLYGGQNGCLNFMGTTTDPKAVYRLLWYGTVWGQLPSAVPAQYRSQVYTGVLNKMPWFDYYLDVIEQGDACNPGLAAGINSIDNHMEATINVYPNPGNGLFDLKLTSAQPVSGALIVTDVTGREILRRSNVDVNTLYQTSFDITGVAAGLYTVQFRTPQSGYICAKISKQ